MKRTKNVPWHILAPAAVACDIYIIRPSGTPAEGFLLYRAQFPVKREKSQKLHMAISDFFIYSSALFG